MHIERSIALVTGSNRGLGRAFAERLLERGAGTVYATARDPRTIDIPGVVPVRLDVRDDHSVDEVAALAGDVTLLVNNAGINTFQNVLTGDPGALELELGTHLFGTLRMIRAFAPLLAANGGGAIVNMLSAMSWFAYDGANAYHVAKAAQWALTNSARIELTAQGTLVTGVHLGLADTDMTAGFDGDKTSPRTVVDAALDGVESGAWEVLVDDWSRAVKSSLGDDPRRFYDPLGQR